MAKLRKNAAGLISRLCAVLLGFLGFGCSSEEDIPLMYGTPLGEFEIKGAVTDEAGVPIEDADVIVTRPGWDSNFEGIYGGITNGLTGANGKFLLEEKRTHPWDSLKVVCIPPGDTFEPDSTVVELNYVIDNKKENNGWYWGKAEAEVNFKLKKKSSE